MKASFDRDALEHLDRVLFSLADRVVPMRDIAMGDTNPRTIGLRHDVDDNEGSFYTALELARWEFDRGYSSTFFLLHGSHYWDAEHLVYALEFQELGHEVGIHVNAIAEALRERRSPEWILLEALSDLRSVGLRVEGCQAHGDALCYERPGMSGDLRFVNDEIFVECRRPAMGDPDRTVRWNKTEVQIQPKPLADYYLRYHASSLPRGDYLSDSGHRWSQSPQEVVNRFGQGQLHMLMHPDWWGAAFPKVTA
jgi:hypothetical protein